MMRRFLYLGIFLSTVLIMASCYFEAQIDGEFDLSSSNVVKLSPYMDIINGQILNVSETMEYSSNNKELWTDCGGAIVSSLSFVVGNKVWVREKDSPSTEVYLGEVLATSGRADLIFTKNIYPGYVNGSFKDYNVFKYGYAWSVCFSVKNIGDTAALNSGLTMKVYLSSDRNITSQDRLIATTIYSLSIASGAEAQIITSIDLPLVDPGVYYLGYIIDTTNVVSELNEMNNTTLADSTAEVTLQDTTSNLKGAFKFVNSWGEGGWENVADGHIWVTYAAMIEQNYQIIYYYNNFNEIYEPKIVAVFNINHNYRDECKITIGVGDPADPVLEKVFQAQDESGGLVSGPLAFPSNDMILDISEFYNYVKDYNVFLKVENSGTTTGSIDAFSVEVYTGGYDGSPDYTVTGGTAAIGSGGTVSVIADTKTALAGVNISDMEPVLRASSTNPVFIEQYPSADEAAWDAYISGGSISTKKISKVKHSSHGTGYIAPTQQDLLAMKKLQSIRSGMYSSTGSEELLGSTYTNKKVDLSQTKYFPPIGNQGSENSCVAFAVGYYMHTYSMARENNWDLSATTWVGGGTGAPNSNLDEIFSPDFIYHQINYGVDKGSVPSHAVSLVIRIGVATWNTMPNDVVDHTTWPSAAAYREAAKYRGREVANYYNDYKQCGYFIIMDDADINLLKNLLANGYVVVTGIASYLYYEMSSKDVLDSVGYYPVKDHANTIVGFKDGAAWDPASPES